MLKFLIQYRSSDFPLKIITKDFSKYSDAIDCAKRIKGDVEIYRMVTELKFTHEIKEYK